MAAADIDPWRVAARLEAVRERTLALVSVVGWETLCRQVTPILSPMIWDLGHIAKFEELWLGRELAGRQPLGGRYDRLFDAVLNPRPTRASLPLPEGRDLFGYLEAVRTQSLESLFGSDADLEPELAAEGFVFELVAQHEEQHQETLLQAMQLLEDPPYSPAQRRWRPSPRPVERGMVTIPAGPFLMGREGSGFAYDNEKVRHQVELPEYRIDRFPVTQGDFLAFVEEGGYRRRELWSGAGWAWRQESGVEAPGNWVRREGAWHLRFMDRVLPLAADKPVVHVSWHEAEAYAHFAGKRLPSEAEWEKAALWDPDAGRPRLYPWGDEAPDPLRANVDQLCFEPVEVGAYPGGASAYGVEQMVGDAWEWTASDFGAYPDFRAFPYPEYSEIFFGGDYKVLRGGSWATRPRPARGTFRNWDLPIRRQIFAGFRCAA